MQKERKKETGQQLGKPACAGTLSFPGTYGLHVTVLFQFPAGLGNVAF